ncbi:hypothetical protein AWENTII_004958 [Aspergillus wentii]|nr:hypothetical protein MW887_008968 [Aspergillus wentii]
MSATILSRIVGLDELIPRPVDIEREDKDVEASIPWIFQHASTAGEDSVSNWPGDMPKFSNLFDDLPSYCAEFGYWKANEGHESTETGLASALRERETITLPRKSWKVSENQRFGRFIETQTYMLRALMMTTYLNLEGIKTQHLEIHYGLGKATFKYVIGGQKYAARPQGAVTVGPRTESLPIISFTGWFEGQTWGEFLAETLGVMIGQLVKNISVQSSSTGFQDQEVFVIGFHGCQIHIARGYFTTDVISRVHSKGCSEKDVFELNFTQGYNLCLKEDWLEALRALTRLFRYLHSGNAKVGAIQAYLQRGSKATEDV